MFNKIVQIFADAIAAAVAREVAKQLPNIAEAIAGAVADRVLKQLPDLSDVDDKLLHTTADIAEKVVAGVVDKLPKIKIPFLS